MLRNRGNTTKNINDALDILNKDGMWTTERVDFFWKNKETIRKIMTWYKNVFALDKSLKRFTKISEKGQQFNLIKKKLIDNLKYVTERVKVNNSENASSFNPTKLVSNDYTMCGPTKEKTLSGTSNEHLF